MGTVSDNQFISFKINNNQTYGCRSGRISFYIKRSMERLRMVDSDLGFMIFTILGWCQGYQLKQMRKSKLLALPSKEKLALERPGKEEHPERT